MGYTRGDEAQADELGFAFYTRAGWDPNHFADFFQQMIDLGYDKTPEVFRVDLAKRTSTWVSGPDFAAH